MGLDHYLHARCFTSAHFVPKAHAELEKLYKAFPAPAPPREEGSTIYIQVEVIRWRKSYAIHDWWITHAGFEEDANYVDSETIIAFDKWVAEIFMSQSPAFAKERMAELSGSWSNSEEIDQYFWEDFRRTMVVTGQLVTAIQAKPEHALTRNWDFYYDGSW